MSDGEIASLHNTALGEGLYAALSQEALWGLLVSKGFIDRLEAADTLDRTLLVLEKYRATVRGSPGAVDHARKRLEGMIRLFRPETIVGT